MKIEIMSWVALSGLWLMFAGSAALKEGQCEVCVKVLDRFVNSLDEDVKKNQEKVEQELKNFCKNLKNKEERFCYYIGGLETSATNILRMISKPIGYHMPAEKLCSKLKEADGQICELKYDKEIDLASVNLKKLKVKDLKKILSNWGEDNACKGCAEKSDFIKVVEELMPKYAPEAAKKRKTEL